MFSDTMSGSKKQMQKHNGIRFFHKMRALLNPTIAGRLKKRRARIYRRYEMGAVVLQ